MNHHEPTIKLILRSVPTLRTAAGLAGDAPEDFDRRAAQHLIEIIRDNPVGAMRTIADSPELATLLLSYIEDTFRRWEKIGGNSKHAQRQRNIARRIYVDGQTVEMVRAELKVKNTRIVREELAEAEAQLAALLLGADGLLEQIFATTGVQLASDGEYVTEGRG